MIDKIIEIEIYGRLYKIRVKGEEDEKTISQVTSFVDQRMHEIAAKSKSTDPLKIAVLAALNIADDFFLTRRKIDQMDDVIGRVETAMDDLEKRLTTDDHASLSIEKAAL
jgi:cell division protein ZapA